MAAEPHFVYLTEVDVSIDNGRGINEREFVRSLRTGFPSTVTCILPEPACPETFHDPGIVYVRSHRAAARDYVPHLVASFRSLAALHRRRRIDGLVMRLAVAPLIAYCARRFLGIPVIIKTLAPVLIFWEAEPPRTVHARISRLFRPMLRSVIRNAALVDTMSPEFAAALKPALGLPDEKVALIRNHANTELFVPADRGESRRRLELERFDRIIGYAGSLGSIRHLDTLILSLRRIDPAERVGLVLVGDGEERPRLEALVRQERLEARVVFTGNVPYAAVPQYIQAFDVGIDLNLQPLPAGDGVINTAISQKIGQYLGCGVPVLVWDVLDNAFVIEAGVAVGVPLSDDAAVADGVRELLALSQREGERLAKRARAFAETHLSSDVLTAQRVALWRRAVGAAR